MGGDAGTGATGPVAGAPVALLLPDPAGRRVLARPNGLAGWALPRVVLAWPAAWQAVDVATAARSLRGPVAPVRRVATGVWEVTRRGRIGAAGADWVDRDEVGRLGADAAVTAAWFGAGSGPGSAPAPFEQPGWHDAVEDWVATALGRDVLDAHPLRHWELSAVTALDLSAGRADRGAGGGDGDPGRIVVKETRDGFGDEAAVLTALAGLPGVPTLRLAAGRRVAVDHVAGRDGHPDDWPAVLGLLGTLQRAAVERSAALPAAPPPPQPDDPADPADPDGTVEEARAVVDALGMPDTVVHGDLHPGNWLVGAGGPVIVDWTDARRGPPALDLRLALLGREHDPHRLDPWLTAWSDTVDPAAVRAAVPAIALAATAFVEHLHHDLAGHVPGPLRPFWDDFHGFWRRLLVADRERFRAVDPPGGPTT